MTSIPQDQPAEENGWLVRADRWLERMGERLNPILVKESRQALKSKQFLITFLLLLVCGWAWSMIGVAQQAGSIYYSASGTYMLAGYFVIVIVPMMLIVPFSAFRSLAAERENDTFELLSITTLSARQIVMGKLGVAILQMIVYYSAVTPFIAFTYLLRGVDVPTLFFLLTHTFLMALSFSSISLLLGTISRAIHWQVLLSVITIAALGLGTIVWASFTLGEALQSPMPTDDFDFWMINALLATLELSYVAICVVAAAAQISFPSDNRSTKIRVALLAQQLIWIGWMSYVWMHFGDDEFLSVIAIMAGISWAIMGAMMTGELPQLSPRVKRSLPQSALGRVFLTWFNPGSGTGYAFAVLNLGVVCFLVCAMVVINETVGFVGSPRSDEDAFACAVLIWSYVAGYLGVGRLIILAARRFFQFGIIIALIIQVVLALAGAIIPAVLQAMLYRVFSFDYSPLQLTNWFWTIGEVVDGGSGFWNSGGIPLLGLPVVLLLAPLGAMFIFLINLVVASNEVEQERQATPQRVMAEDAESQETAMPVVSPLD